MKELFKNQQERGGVLQKPARERRSYSKTSKREEEFFKIQKESEGFLQNPAREKVDKEGDDGEAQREWRSEEEERREENHEDEGERDTREKCENAWNGRTRSGDGRDGGFGGG